MEGPDEGGVGVEGECGGEGSGGEAMLEYAQRVHCLCSGEIYFIPWINKSPFLIELQNVLMYKYAFLNRI